MNDFTAVLTFIAAMGCGLNGGIFFAFSTFVMAGLRRLPPAQGVAAMQSINVTAPTPAFMGLFLGTAVVSLAAMVVTLFDWQSPASVYVVAGGAAYLAGCIILTVAFHVPRNNRLADLDPNSTEAADYWRKYLAEWVAGNHVRTLAGLTAAALFTAALLTG